jgi:predicted RNA-binding protein
MSTRNYWVDSFTSTTWQEFLDAGADVSGFRESRWRSVQHIEPGDYLLCYLTGLSRWVGILEVISEPYKDTTQIWKEDVFPSRARVKVVVKLTPVTAVPIKELSDQLSIFENVRSPGAWTGILRGSPRKWKVSDAEVVEQAILEAKRNPVTRPIARNKLDRQPIVLRTRIGSVTLPGIDVSIEKPGLSAVETSPAPIEPRLRTEIQWLLLKLGNDMGLDVWVATNDRSQGINGHKYTDLPNLKKELPLQFDAETTQIIKLIDVLWLNGNAIIAAFEIECTTSIYSGLLRMADLISMQPNIKIPLYLVAPDERRAKVITEINRPTFSRLHPPMQKICRYISIPLLRERISQLEKAVELHYVSPDFLEGLSEYCEVAD